MPYIFIRFEANYIFCLPVQASLQAIADWIKAHPGQPLPKDFKIGDSTYKAVRLVRGLDPKTYIGAHHTHKPCSESTIKPCPEDKPTLNILNVYRGFNVHLRNLSNDLKGTEAGWTVVLIVSETLNFSETLNLQPGCIRP